MRELLFQKVKFVLSFFLNYYVTAGVGNTGVHFVRPAGCLGYKLKFGPCMNTTKQEGKLTAFGI
jgi:hypothetical protein